MIILRSELLNDQHLSALELAAKCGAVELVKKMVQIRRIFSTKHKDTYQYDVTDLLPDTIVNKVVDDTTSNHQEVVSQQEPHLDKPLSKVFPGGASKSFIAKRQNVQNEKNIVSLLEMVVKAKPLNVANEMLNIVPLRQIVADYWVIYQYIYGILMILHITYMACYSIYSVPAARDAINAYRTKTSNATLVTDVSPSSAYVAFLIWPLILLAYQVYYIGNKIYRCVRKLDLEEPAFSEIEGRWYSFSNLPSAFLALVLYYLPTITSISFSVLTICWLFMYLDSDPMQSYISATCLLIGWLLTICFSHGFESVHGFTQMLANIFVRDVVRFFFLYMFILLGFGFAFETLIQLSVDLQEEFPDTAIVFQQTFGMMIGAGDLMVEDIDTRFSNHGYSATYFKFLYLTYALVTVVVLLNLLIAMMSDSYAEVKEREGTSYRVESIAMAIRLEKSIPILPKLFTLLGFKNRNIDYDENTGWYMMTLRREEVEEILEEDLDYTEKMLHKLDGKLDRLRETQDEIWDMVDVLGSRVSRLEKDAIESDTGHDDDDNHGDSGDDDDDDDDDYDSPYFSGHHGYDDNDDADGQGGDIGDGKSPFKHTPSGFSRRELPDNDKFKRPPDVPFSGSYTLMQTPPEGIKPGPLNDTMADHVTSRKKKKKRKKKSVDMKPGVEDQSQKGTDILESVVNITNYPSWVGSQ